MATGKKQYTVSLDVTMVVTANTVEEAKQKVDNAVDYSVLRARGIVVRSESTSVYPTE